MTCMCHQLRQRATRLRLLVGSLGELITSWQLTRQGFIIVSRNWQPNRNRSYGGELDIVAVRGDELLFVEVKTRRAKGYMYSPLDNITKRKQTKIDRLVNRYLEYNHSVLSSWKLRTARVVGVGIGLQRIVPWPTITFNWITLKEWRLGRKGSENL